ncbi:MAG: class I SAM-dependent methyltransferase [Caulobacteraceae bacterium]
MTGPTSRGKKRNLNSLVRETLLSRKYRAARHPYALDYDWAAIRYNRVSLVNLLLSADPGGDYLEIGCASNLLFDSVMAARKTGVDPASGGTHRQTSDEFFDDHVDARFDVAFIDGLHHYDQVRRDLVNCLRAVRAGGWIALHDMLPRDWIEEHVPQISTGRWTGDAWKVAFELMATPGVDFRLVAIDHGVGVLRLLADRPHLADLRPELATRRFAWFHQHFARLPVLDYDAARAWIDGHLGAGPAAASRSDQGV